MSREQTKSAEAAAFKARLSKLLESKEIDDAAFADAIYAAMSTFGIDEGQFRDTYGLTKGAVDRWTQRQNLPQPLVRPKIIAWIRDKL